ncbi:MAG: hypothetical protein KJ749_11600 [Planctomycetes bacterium]|nr:hypothetical protein [Planctomycetota bacterium]
MEFTVPDRGHDPAGDELIRYAWSGTPGDPLTYEYNGGAAVDLIPEVFEFNLAYGATTVMEEVPGEPTESGQVLFAILTTGTGLTSGSVTSSRWYGEYIHPAGFNSTPLPGDVVSWSIDVIGFRARQSGYAVGHTLLRVYAATPDGKPDTTALLAEATVNESDLPVPPAYFTLWSVPFHGSIIGLSPDQGICFTLTTEDAYPSLETQYYTGPLAMPDCGMLVSTDAGASWAVSATAGLRFSLYGKYVTLGEPQEVSSSYSTNIHISLRAGDRPGSRVDTSVTIPNGPKVTVP